MKTLMTMIAGSLLLVSLVGCQAEETSVPMTTQVTETASSEYVSDDPCGWDDPGAYHVTDMGHKYWYARKWFNDALDPNQQYLQLSIESDGNAYIAWRDDNVPFYTEYQATWTRVPGQCMIELKAVGTGQTLILVGNPGPLDYAPCGGFYEADLFGSIIPFVPDGRHGFSNGHAGAW